MRLINIILLSKILICSLNISAQVQQSRTIFFGGETREYIIYVPSIYSSSTPSPLMFSFHGGGGDGQAMIGLNDMRPIADTANFIAVYPSGSGGAWMHKVPTTYNDIYFIEAIIDELNLEFNIDNDRVYACGYSEGGIFSYELACRLSNRIAAVASVSGSMMTDAFRSDPAPNGYGFPACSPSHPTAVMFIPGTIDMNPHSMYNGLSPYYMSASEISSYWSTQNNTNSSPNVISIPNTNTQDGSTVERKIWENGDNCVSVVELKINNGDHDWPGTFGNMDIDASQEIWNFVSKHDINGLINCNSTSIIDNKQSVQKKLVKVIDLLGKQNNLQRNNIQFLMYENGIVKKQIIIN
tara:strand:+ start:372 stop:1430 length:1059 start_codon:yes stop_codon:yes gene_type:complete